MAPHYKSASSLCHLSRAHFCHIEETTVCGKEAAQKMLELLVMLVLNLDIEIKP